MNVRVHVRVCVWISVVLVNIFLLLLQLQLLLMKEDLVFSSSRFRFPDVICPSFTYLMLLIMSLARYI